MASLSSSRSRGLAAAVLAVLAVAAAPARDAGAAGTLSQKHRDPTYKFSFLYYDDWSPIPIPPDEKYAVARYVQKGAAEKGIYGSRVTVYRYMKGKAGEGVTTEGDGEKKPPEIPPEILEKLGIVRPKRLFDVYQNELKHPDAKFDRKLDEAKGVDVATKDKVPGKMWTVMRATPWGATWNVLTIWSKPGEDLEYGMWLECEDTQKKKLDQGFKTLYGSFLWFDAKAREVGGLEALDGLPITAEKRRVIQKGLVKGWGLIVSPKKNYVVLYNREKGNRNDLLAHLIAERIEKIREQVYEVQFPPSAPIKAISLVRVCGDRSEYHAYGGPGGSAGYWNDGDEELVFYDASPSKKPDDDTFAVLYHEAFHQYIYYSVGEVAPHSWFNEGHGDYYAGAKYADGKFRIGPFNWRIGEVKGAIAAGPSPSSDGGTGRDGKPHKKFDRAKGGYTPLQDLVAFTQGEYYSYPGVSYAQGWSLIYFLREIVPKNPKWNAKWGKILDVYFDTLKAEVNKKTPLGPKKVDPVPPPGPDPAMGDDAPPATPDDEPPSEPSMGEPGMGEPGMGEPPAPPAPPDNPEDTMGIPQFSSRFMSEDSALESALQKAFAGIDWAEFEDAWKSSIRKVNG
jgi:hypothetical protein